MNKEAVIKQLASLIVRSALKLTGFRAYIVSIIIKKLLEAGYKEGSKVIEQIKDKQTIKEGDKLEQLPVSPDVIKDREDNFQDLIEGRK